MKYSRRQSNRAYAPVPQRVRPRPEMACSPSPATNFVRNYGASDEMKQLRLARAEIKKLDKARRVGYKPRPH